MPSLADVAAVAAEAASAPVVGGEAGLSGGAAGTRPFLDPTTEPSPDSGFAVFSFPSREVGGLG